MKKYLRNLALISGSFIAGNIVGVLFTNDKIHNNVKEIKGRLFLKNNDERYITEEMENIRCYMDNLSHLKGDVLRNEIKYLKKRSSSLLKNVRKNSNPKLEEEVFNFREELFNHCNKLLTEMSEN